MAQQSPIFVKTEAFMVWLFDHTRKFPVYERFRLAKRADDSLFEFHACLILATAQTASIRENLWLADVELDKLRAYLRLAVELKYLTVKQFTYAAAQTAELGKLLGGWLKTLEH